MVETEDTKEKVIATLGSIVLTEDTVYSNWKTLGSENYTNIFLRDISFIHFGYKSHPVLLLLAIVSVVCSFIYDIKQIFILTAILIVLFYISRKRFITISSHSKQNINEPLKCDTKEAKIFIQEIINTKRKVHSTTGYAESFMQELLKAKKTLTS